MKSNRGIFVHLSEPLSALLWDSGFGMRSSPKFKDLTRVGETGALCFYAHRITLKKKIQSATSKCVLWCHQLVINQKMWSSLQRAPYLGASWCHVLYGKVECDTQPIQRGQRVCNSAMAIDWRSILVSLSCLSVWTSEGLVLGLKGYLDCHGGAVGGEVWLF